MKNLPRVDLLTKRIVYLALFTDKLKSINLFSARMHAFPVSEDPVWTGTLVNPSFRLTV